MQRDLSPIPSAPAIDIQACPFSASTGVLIYYYGPPGTGKSTSVSKVLNTIRKSRLTIVSREAKKQAVRDE